MRHLCSRIGKGGHTMSKRLPARQKCIRVKPDGTRCGNWPLTGQRICKFHGGNAPQNLARARLMMIELVDPSIKALRDVLFDPHAEHKDKVRAAVVVLDRCGIGPEQILKVLGIEEADPWQQAMHAFLELLPASSEEHRVIAGDLADDDEDDTPQRSQSARRAARAQRDGSEPSDNDTEDELPDRSTRQRSNGDVGGGGDFADEWSGRQSRSAPGMAETPPKYGKRPPPQPPVRSRRVGR
jgi:hypothetical protein